MGIEYPIWIIRVLQSPFFFSFETIDEWNQVSESFPTPRLGSNEKGAELRGCGRFKVSVVEFGYDGYDKFLYIRAFDFLFEMFEGFCFDCIGETGEEIEIAEGMG